MENEAKLNPNATQSVNMEMPKERFHKCKNKMLECIHSYENLSVNGSKDSAYSDLISFEKHFEEWDYNLIILEKITYGHEGGVDGRPYVYLTVEGIFDNIGMFARQLQKILPHSQTDKTISIMDFGGDMTIHIHSKGDYTPFKEPSYQARQMRLNQITDDSNHEGHKWHITKL